MSSMRTWLALAIAVPAVLGLFAIHRPLFYSFLPPYENRVASAQHVLAYHQLSCPGAYLFASSEGSITLQCNDPGATRYRVSGMLPCTETVGCRWFDILCWVVEKQAQ
jgi:hypothetical protein